MNKYGMIFGVIMFAAGFFAHSALFPSVATQVAIAPSTDKPIPVQAARPNSSDPDTLALKKQIAQLESQMASLKQRTAMPLDESTPIAAEKDADGDSSQPQMVSIELEKLRRLIAAKAKREAEERGDFQSALDGNPDSTVANVKNIFSEENIDYSWATPQETKLYDTFSSAEKLAGLSITETVCKTSVCRVSVSVAANESFDSEALTKAVSESGANAGFRSIMTIHQLETGLVDIYFSK